MPRLTIELVPSSSWFSNVRSEVPPEVWDHIRKTVYRAAHYKCQICSGRGRQHPVECHEVWHYDDQKFVQTLVRMIALCPLCHQVKHMGRTIEVGEAEPAISHMMRVNKWNDRRTADLYIDEAFQLWATRSRFPWTLNLDHLRSQYGITVAKKEPLETRAAEVPPAPQPAWDPFDHIIDDRVA